MSRKKNQVSKVVILLVLLMTPSILFGMPKGLSIPKGNGYPIGPEILDLSVEQLGEKEIAIRQRAAQVGPAIASNVSPSGSAATIGEELNITVSDSGLGIDYPESFVVVLDGIHGIILVEKSAYDGYDPVTDEYVFPNPAGTFERFEDRISTAKLQYMLQQFDDVIYPTNTGIFGEHLPRGAEGQKVWILIHNIRDEAYYDAEAKSYIAGYFSASEDSENNKNMMHIDTYDWENRTGTEGARPLLYEGTFAHEFEHLIHFDQDPDEPSWVDEGLADLAAYLCGYGHSAGHVAYYLVYHPMVSLTFWGGELEDYGASYLFQLYLFEKYGGAELVTNIVQEQANGIEGITKALRKTGYWKDFDVLFDQWTQANYLDNLDQANGKLGYESLEIGSADTMGYTIEYALNELWVGPATEGDMIISSDWFYGIEPLPYTAHYFRYLNPDTSIIAVDGDDFAGTMAYSGTYEWSSGALAWASRSISRNFDIPDTGATLNFMTFYEIEEDWDYGYVEVYDNDTGLWTTLAGAGTITNLAHPQDNPNTPDEREPMTYALNGTWNAFTGESGGWVPVTMDLTPFAGHNIDLYFSTWQDGAFTLQMMYIDDISIPEIGYFDDVEGDSDWTSTGWEITDGVLDNGLSVIGMNVLYVQDTRYPDLTARRSFYTTMVDLAIDPVLQQGADILKGTRIKPGSQKVVIVSNHADHILSSHYDLGIFTAP